MTRDLTQRATALIEHIQTRFHGGHRRALPELLALAAAVEAQAIDKGLVDALGNIGHALEQHMFKEEMRLFPMMEQGGNTLIERLIADLHREHGEHLPAVQELQSQLRTAQATSAAQPILAQLVQDVDDFTRKLTEHIRLEDEVLFPLFCFPAAAGARTALIA